MAFGDVVQTVTHNVWTQGNTVTFAAPTRGNLLVLRIAESGSAGFPTVPTGWTRQVQDAGLWGGLSSGSVCIMSKIADGSEGSLNLTGVLARAGGSVIVQEFAHGGYGFKVLSTDVGTSDASSIRSFPSASYNNTQWPLILCSALGLIHDFARPNTFVESGNFDGIAAVGIAANVPAFDTNNNFATCASINHVLPADQASDQSVLDWTNPGGSNSNQGVTVIFLAVGAPWIVAATTQVTGTGVSLTPDFSAITPAVAAGDLVLVHVTNRNNNTPTAPASQGWSTVYNHSRAAGTAFNDTVFAKIWGIPGNTDDTTPTFSVASGTLGWGATATVIRNPLHPWQAWTAVVDAILFSATDNSTAAAATATAPSATITRPAPDRTYVRIFATADNNALNAPSAGTLVYGDTSYDQTTGDDYSQALVSQEDQDNASSTGTVTVNESVNGNDVALTGTLVLGVEPKVPWRHTRVAPSLAALQRASW